MTKVTTVSLEQESVGTDQASGVDVRRDGLLHIVKGKRSAPLPTNPEQLRDVFRVMGLHWEMVHLKGAGRSVLKDYSPLVFEKHVEFLLGDECYRIGEANPTMACRPSWDLLLKYDFELRKYAIKKGQRGRADLGGGGGSREELHGAPDEVLHHPAGDAGAARGPAESGSRGSRS